MITVACSNNIIRSWTPIELSQRLLNVVNDHTNKSSSWQTQRAELSRTVAELTVKLNVELSNNDHATIVKAYKRRLKEQEENIRRALATYDTANAKLNEQEDEIRQLRATNGELLAKLKAPESSNIHSESKKVAEALRKSLASP